MSISNCGHDERYKYSGGAAGDQTGGEYAVVPWYDRPWNVILRAPDKKTGARLAQIARKAAQNNKIGYDQSQRKTYYLQLKKVNYHPDDIKTKCEADCSSSTAANVIATGYQLGNKKLQKVSPDCWTGNLKAALKAAGFKVLTDKEYLNSPDLLLPGDILLNEKHHVAINLTEGKKAAADALKYPTVNLTRGSTGLQVKKLQRCLNQTIHTTLEIDGSYGPLTEKAVKSFQKKYKLVVDGHAGPKTRGKIKELVS